MQVYRACADAAAARHSRRDAAARAEQRAKKHQRPAHGRHGLVRHGDAGRRSAGNNDIFPRPVGRQTESAQDRQSIVHIAQVRAVKKACAPLRHGSGRRQRQKAVFGCRYCENAGKWDIAGDM